MTSSQYLLKRPRLWSTLSEHSFIASLCSLLSCYGNQVSFSVSAHKLESLKAIYAVRTFDKEVSYLRVPIALANDFAGQVLLG